MILLRPGRGAPALAALRSICERLSLALSEEKSRVVDARREAFRFLGFEIQKVLNPKTAKSYPRTRPAPKSETRLRERLREITSRWRGNRPTAEIVEEMNRVLRGWGHYFHYGHPQQAMARLNYFAAQRLRKWLVRRRRRPAGRSRSGPRYSRYPTGMLYGPLGLYRLPTARPGATAHASRPGSPAHASRCTGTPKAVCGHAPHRRSPTRTHGLTRGRRKRSHGAD